MNNDTDNSCWGITGWALLGFVALIAAAYVFGINDGGQVEAAVSQIAS